MNQKLLTIGVFGFGCVGQGLYDVLNKTEGIKARIKKICVKSRDKKRRLSSEWFTFDRNEILNDPEIDIVVELIDDADAAFEIVTAAMKNGKGVVTANKKMVAEHFEELFNLQHQCNVPFLYEASSCASIPIIRNLEEYYDNDLLTAVEGIFNGSTNYILTKVFNENKNYEVALKEAQELGFAESDPTLDVKAYDPKYKLTILTAHAFGIFLKPENIFNYGIHHLGKYDMQYAREKGCKVKLIANSRKIGNKLCVWVMPQFITPDNKLFFVENEFNAVILEGIFSDKQLFVGKGAGSFPTGSAVLSDISALTYHYKYEYKKHFQPQHDLVHTNDFMVEIYLRFNDDKVLKEVKFESIEESFKGKNYSYVVGKIKWSDLMKSTVVNNPGVFFAQTANSEIQFTEKEKITGRKKEKAEV